MLKVCPLFFGIFAEEAEKTDFYDLVEHLYFLCYNLRVKVYLNGYLTEKT